jgi:signal transduction histidine kinase
MEAVDDARLRKLLHDLGNPLTAITTNVEFLNDVLGDFSKLPPTQVALLREVLSEIAESAARMRAVTRDLREVIGEARSEVE